MMALSLIGVSMTRSQPNFSEQAFGDFESPAVDADVFANDDHAGIGGHLFEQGLTNGFKKGDGSHD